MKKLFLLLLSAVFCFASCYDDSALQDSVANLENRVKTLEELCEDMNTNISSIQTIVNALNDKDYVTGVEKIMENGKEVGYKINFTKSGSIEIRNGENGKDGQNGLDGKDGKDGKVPAISVMKDADGTYYWTLDGEWLVVDGERIKASATDGKDAVLPQLKIEEGMWYIKVGEGAWTMMGQATGDSFFKDVKVGENDVTVTLADGQSFVLPMKAELAINFTLPAQPTAGETVNVQYEIIGTAAKTQVKAICQNGWSAKVTQKTYKTGVIAVTAPNPVTNDEIVVLVSDEEGHVIMNSISWVENEVLIASTEKVNVTADAGTFSLTIDTNTEYEVVIDQPWVRQAAQTKAMRTETLNFEYDNNSKTVAREAKISLNQVGGAEILSIIVAQEKGNYALDFVQHIGEITAAAGEYTIPVNCENLPAFEAQSNQEWATTTVKDGILTVAVTTNVAAPRQAEIKVVSDQNGEHFEDTFYLIQMNVSATADVVDLELSDEGIAVDRSAMNNSIVTTLGNELAIQKLEPYGINAAIFSHGYNKTPAADAGSYTFYEKDLRPAMEDGFSMEALVMCSMAPLGGGKESKAFSSTATGGLALMLHGTRKDLTFLICGDVEPTDAKVWRFIESGIIPEAGQWYHVIGTWDKATGVARIYVNGTLANEVQLPANIKMHWSSLKDNAYFTIGANSSKGTAEAPGFNNSWDGGVAAARIYSEVLTPEQIAATEINLYNGKIRFSEAD